MIENYRIEIELSKVKLTKLLVVSILFLSGGLWILITNPQVSNPIFNNPISKSIASYGGVSMGLCGIYFFTKKLFDKNYGLVIDEQGICDNSSIFNFGPIPWSDISNVYEYSIQASIASKQRFVTVEISNQEKYISKQTNVIKRKLLTLTSKSHGLKLNISANGLKIKHPELLKIMTEAFEQYKNTA